MEQVPFLYKNQVGGFKAHPDSWNLGLDMNKAGLPDTPEARTAFMKDLVAHGVRMVIIASAVGGFGNEL